MAKMAAELLHHCSHLMSSGGADGRMAAAAAVVERAATLETLPRIPRLRPEAQVLKQRRETSECFPLFWFLHLDSWSGIFTKFRESCIFQVFWLVSCSGFFWKFHFPGFPESSNDKPKNRNLQKMVTCQKSSGIFDKVGESLRRFGNKIPAR